jgi:hypothetical protein
MRGAILAVASVLVLSACLGPSSHDGKPGPAGPNVHGRVTELATGRPIEGTSLAFWRDGVPVTAAKAGHDGRYALELSDGDYEVRLRAGCAAPLALPFTVHGSAQKDYTIGLEAGAPKAPIQLQASRDPLPGYVALKWSPAPGQTNEISHYVVERKGSAPFSRILGNTLSFLDAPGATAEYGVHAVDACGRRGEAATVSATPDPAISIATPVAPRAFTVPSLEEHSYRVLDANWTPVRNETWRVVRNTGNCCELYVTTTPTGRILDFGGTYLHYSDDEGRTWSELPTPLPYNIGEGAVASAPGGDIVGVGWNAWDGDRLWANKWDATQQKWFYAPIEIHGPFYDRPWIATVKGPFDVDGRVVPYATMVVNFHPSILMSYDGLHYFSPSQSQVDLLRASTRKVPGSLPLDLDRDWTQPHVDSGITALHHGLAVRAAAGGESCSTIATGLDLRWACSDVAMPKGYMIADSWGRLHNFEPEGNPALYEAYGNSFHYRISHDAGRSWYDQTLKLPKGWVVEVSDMKANAQLDVFALAIHAHTANNTDQDLVMRFSGLDAAPRLVDILEVGDGDYSFDIGLTARQARFDFSTMGFLPDGRIVVSFGDEKHHPAALAIQT